MPSGVGTVFAVPPGNGSVAPFAKRTSRAVAVATTGAPEPLNEIAPIQSAVSVPGSGVALNFVSVSGAAVLNTGASSFRKLVNGVASSPGGGLIAARLRRYSGTRINTLRKKLVRVAAPRKSPLFAACDTAFTCSFTSSGHDDDRAVSFAPEELTVAASFRFAATRVSSTNAAKLSGCTERIC